MLLGQFILIDTFHYINPIWCLRHYYLSYVNKDNNDDCSIIGVQIAKSEMTIITVLFAVNVVKT